MRPFAISASFSLTLAAFFLLSSPAFAGTMGNAIRSALPTAQDAYGYLHSNPEIGKKELLAQNYITAKLRALGFTEFAVSPSAPTAVITIFDSGRAGKTIALRSEIDARPLPDGQVEPASHNPRSKLEGVMHNCGHDVHAAILLATAALVRTNPTRFSGKIVFVFQPAEEIAGGADDIIRDGTLQKLGVEQIYALHSAPHMPVGTIGLTAGPILAGSNYFTLTLSGRASHAASPHEGDDVILSAMRIAQDLSYFPSRELDVAERPTVISITKFMADSNASNTLPNSVTLHGTIRAFEDLTTPPPGVPTIESLIVDRINKLSTVYGLTPKWELRPASPPMNNDAALFKNLAPVLVENFSGYVDTNQTRGMFSEDFAYYTSLMPALYASLGVAKDDLGSAGVHSLDFTIHPDSLAVGIELMSRFAEFGTTNKIVWK